MVLNLGAQKLYTFYSQPKNEVMLALNEMVAAKDRLGLFTPNSKGLYETAVVFSKQLQNVGSAGVLAKIGKSLVSMISVDLIKSFISNPSDPEILESLSSQIFLIAAATDNLPSALKELKPYDDEEIELILKGGLGYYDDILFVYTLRQMITGVISSTQVSKLLNSLPPAPKEEEYENNDFFWLDVLISSLILQVAWTYFADLSDVDRKFLLQNYLYHSLVVGVPVKDRLLIAYNGLKVEQIDKDFDGFVRMLDYNVEFIPTSAEAVFGVKISDTIHQFLPSVYEEKIKTFAQEKFIGEFYKDEPNTQAMQGWLRDLLNLVTGLHDHIL